MKIFKGLTATLLVLSLIMITGCVKVELNESPQAVILKMQTAMQAKKDKNIKGKSNGTMDIEIKSDKINGYISGTVESEYSAENISNPQFGMNLKLKAKGMAEGINGELSANLDFRMLNKTIFLMVNEITANSSENPEIANQVGLAKAFITGKWWKFPIPQDAQQLNMGNPFMMNNKEVTEEQAEQIKTLLKELALLNVRTDLGSKDGNYNFIVELNTENIATFIKKTAEIMGEAITPQQEQKIKIGLMEVANLQAEVAIDGKTFELEKITNGTFKVKDPESTSEVMIEFGGELSGKKTVINGIVNINNGKESAIVTINVNFTNSPNSNVNIQEPQDAEELPFGAMSAPPMDENMMDESMMMQQ